MTHLNLIYIIVRNTCAADNALVRQHRAGQYVWYVRDSNRLAQFNYFLPIIVQSYLMYYLTHLALQSSVSGSKKSFIYFN